MFGHQLVKRFDLLQFGLGADALGDVARRTHGADDFTAFVDKGRLVHFQIGQPALQVAVLFKFRRHTALQGDGVAVLAEFTKGVPLRVFRVALAFTQGKEHVGLAHRFVGVGGVEQVPAKRAVGKQVAFVQVLGPDHVGHVVGHQAQQAGQVA